MFESYYNLNKKPFNKTPDPSVLFYSRSHREAFARLMHGVEEKEIVLLTGEVGCGKTTLSRALMDEIDNKDYRIITIVNPVFSKGELLKYFAIRLGVIDPSSMVSELMDQIAERLYFFYANSINTVLIIDEAHLLPTRDVLDELRLLTNIQLDSENLFSLVLFAQPELRDRLFAGYFEPFRQRIGVQYHLNPLTYEEMKEYINFRLSNAGRTELLFDEIALEAVYKYSGGVPRKINNICANAIMSGFGKEAHIIDSDIIIDVARDFGLIKL